ncbi:Methionine synthase [Candidatus Magnetoovum chiemensis]|nr:Methionine synthase [Candidatus Magnetoovum chiemensis]
MTKKHLLIEKIKENVIQGRINREDEGFDNGYINKPAVAELINEAVTLNIDAKTIVLEGLTAGMDIVGKRFECGKYLIPDMLASAEAVGSAMDILSPYLINQGIASKGTVVIATVKGDLHDIGKNIVSIMLKGAGYKIIDLGIDVSKEKIADAVKAYNAKFLGLSALLTTTMRQMEYVINHLKESGLRETVKVIIGGAPTSAAFASQIGADAYCCDAFQSIVYTNSVK